MYKIDPDKLNAAMKHYDFTVDMLFSATKLPISERDAFDDSIVGKEEIDSRSLALIAHALDVMPYEISTRLAD